MNARTLVTVTLLALLSGVVPSCADGGPPSGSAGEDSAAADSPAVFDEAAAPVDDPAAYDTAREAPETARPDPGPPPVEPAGDEPDASETDPPTVRPAEPEATASEDRDPGGLSPDSILRATSRAYEGVRSIRASFEQRLENPLLGRTAVSSGVIYQRQPDRFLMQFRDPAGDVIVSDGEYFWMWYPSVDSTQVLRTRRAGTGLDLRSQFIGDPVRRFDATYHGMEAVRGRDAHVFTLVPREPAGYSRLEVWIDARDHLVRRFELAESSGNVRHFELTDLAVNPALPDDLFAFTPPPGARVVTR